ncbi:FG-GAP repeat domain-containing protein [Vibrio ziniensis]|uniref:VCBS repeat-containing protein n=1 Tax=Vibrio ziniensis TaxID=2711221 RepID=A0A6G7CIX6_9VIBR|nr:VCBS repeat-containing protein [Vibrio ziniensis]QIH42091.1 VCBS repeat-containing protein [Vibrio ziniensis]
MPVQNINGYTPLTDAIAYIDANNDGYTDVFVATGSYLLEGEIISELFLNNTSNQFSYNNGPFNGDVVPATHARKTIVADFNGDSLLDMFIADHGYDASPFPGNNPKLIIQDNAGSFSWTRMTDQTGFHHTATAADIDNNGTIDVFVGGHSPFFYINDGNANFTFNDSLFPSRTVYSSELIDVDQDGYVDLLIGAHEFDGAATVIYWGSSGGSFTDANSTTLTSVDSYGTVLDFEAEDLDGDGDKDVVVTRTGGGNSNFYQGVYIQLLVNNGSRAFTDATTQINDNGTASDSWFPWLRAQDLDDDGDIDLFSDDIDDNFLLVNDGSGNFTRSTL